MNLDEQFPDNVDKQMLIQLVNENVIPFTKKILKNAREINLSGVFFYF